MPDGAALTEFLAAHALAPARRVTDADAARAHVLREAMWAVTSAEYDGRPCAAADLRVVDDALQHGAPTRIGRGAGELHARPPADVDEALSRIAAELVSDLTGTQAWPDRVLRRRHLLGVLRRPHRSASLVQQRAVRHPDAGARAPRPSRGTTRRLRPGLTPPGSAG